MKTCVRVWEGGFMYNLEHNQPVINNMQNSFGKGIY